MYFFPFSVLNFHSFKLLNGEWLELFLLLFGLTCHYFKMYEAFTFSFWMYALSESWISFTRCGDCNRRCHPFWLIVIVRSTANENGPSSMCQIESHFRNTSVHQWKGQLWNEIKRDEKSSSCNEQVINVISGLCRIPLN